jgi:hypothetical protein
LLVILSTRSKIPIQNVFEPKIGDDKGHLRHRAMVAVGQQDDEEYVDFQMRIAYHELMDLPASFTGYRDIAQEVSGRCLLRPFTWLLSTQSDPQVHFAEYRQIFLSFLTKQSVWSSVFSLLSFTQRTLAKQHIHQ